MAVRDDGEFELILGNKQLLSVLFIVIVLMGVFFAMGFLAGRSSSPTGPETKTGTIASKSAEPPTQPEAAVPPETTRDAAEPPADRTDVQEAPVEKPVTKKEETRAKKEKETAKAAAVETERKAPAASTSGAPAPGKYLQVAATSRREAEALLALLGRNGFRGALAPSPKSPELMRVLVGPLAENADVAKARENLKKLNIDKPYIVVYK